MSSILKNYFIKQKMMNSNHIPASLILASIYFWLRSLLLLLIVTLGELLLKDYTRKAR